MIRRREGTFRVLQIMPADGWRAVWYDLETGEPFAMPLVCWGLVDWSEDTEDDHELYPALTWAKQSVVGMTTGADGWVDAPESAGSNFLGYLAPGEDLAEIWGESAREAFERRRSRETQP